MDYTISEKVNPKWVQELKHKAEISLSERLAKSQVEQCYKERERVNKHTSHHRLGGKTLVEHY